MACNDIIKYYGKNISYNISNKKRLINLLESDKSDVDEAIEKIAEIKKIQQHLISNNSGKLNPAYQDKLDELLFNYSLNDLKKEIDNKIKRDKKIETEANLILIGGVAAAVAVYLIVRNNPWILELFGIFSNEDDNQDYNKKSTNRLNNQKQL